MGPQEFHSDVGFLSIDDLLFGIDAATSMTLRSLILLAFAVALTHGATLPVAEDSSSLKGKLTATTNKATTLPVDGKRNAFLFFDLTEIPADAQNRYARLKFISRP